MVTFFSALAFFLGFLTSSGPGRSKGVVSVDSIPVKSSCSGLGDCVSVTSSKVTPPSMTTGGMSTAAAPLSSSTCSVALPGVTSGNGKLSTSSCTSNDVTSGVGPVSATLTLVGFLTFFALDAPTSSTCSKPTVSSTDNGTASTSTGLAVSSPRPTTNGASSVPITCNTSAGEPTIDGFSSVGATNGS